MREQSKYIKEIVISRKKKVESNKALMQGKNLSKFVSVYWLIERENSIRRCVQNNLFVIFDVNFILKQGKLKSYSILSIIYRFVINHYFRKSPDK